MIREVVKATGDIITVAGNGTAGYSGDNGPATAAELDSPRGVAVDSAGDLFFADIANNVIREVVKATGDIITFAGNGTAGYSGDNGPATAAELNGPNAVAVDSAGDLFIADADNNAIREVVKATGDIITVAGNGNAGYSGDNGPATAAELNDPNGIAVDSVGDVFIADGGNNVVREVVKATGDIITVAGDGTAGYTGDNGPATAAELNGSGRVAVDSAGDLFIADGGNNVDPRDHDGGDRDHQPRRWRWRRRRWLRRWRRRRFRRWRRRKLRRWRRRCGAASDAATGCPAAAGGILAHPAGDRTRLDEDGRPTPEIVIQLDQGIVSTLAPKKVWYSVEAAGDNDVPGTSNDQHLRFRRSFIRRKCTRLLW